MAAPDPLGADRMSTIPPADIGPALALAGRL